ncbi:MAG TPA: bifunctional 3-deoxy-7-phosphoheptulonate synthase/chorismate mutase [Bacteroidia bacterium]|jgi:3-deoxy-7-phosphoheptulonate synthase|nr:bifunctional 3-deoxy-7-phosphoheptulonate synthase/chorismate mutase [Bacteroidia bacterium]
MIIQLETNVQPASKEKILSAINNIGYKTTEVKTQKGSYLVCIGKNEFDIRLIGSLSGVQDVHRVSEAYKLVSRKWKVGRTEVDLGDGVKIGPNSLTIMAGPCSIESEEQVEKIVKHLVANNIKIMRGGVFKPRSSPYAFRGMGLEGLKMFNRVCRAKGIKIITEVMQVSQIADMADYVDVFQVGARNSQNFNLLDELGKVDKPVLIKRGMSGTIDELLQSAEYIFSNGNEKLMLCERGIRTYENAYRNTFDINAIPVLKEKTHLPVIADPSHGVGIREYVSMVALASMVAGADGVIYEVHEKPEEAASDGQQTLNFDESQQLIEKLRALYQVK